MFSAFTSAAASNPYDEIVSSADSLVRRILNIVCIGLASYRQRIDFRAMGLAHDHMGEGDACLFTLSTVFGLIRGLAQVNLEGEAGARNVIAAVQKRFLHRNANVQLFALTVRYSLQTVLPEELRMPLCGVQLSEALVNNCGPALHREVASNSFTESLKRLVTDRVC